MEWSQEVLSGRVASVTEPAKRERLDRRSVRQLLRLGFLSPGIVERIVEERQSALDPEPRLARLSP